MTSLSFPRQMPSGGWGQQAFELDIADYATRNGAGVLTSIQAGFPLWRASWTLANAINPRTSDEWRAFVASLGGAKRRFFGKDVERPYPRAFPNGFAALGWDGDCTSWSQTTLADLGVLTLTGVPNGLVVGPGDYVGFRWTNAGAERRSLVRCVEPADVTASAGSIGFAIEPMVPPVTPADAVAYFANPTCLMRLDMSQTQLSAMGRRRIVGGTVGALQELPA